MLFLEYMFKQAWGENKSDFLKYSHVLSKDVILLFCHTIFVIKIQWIAVKFCSVWIKMARSDPKLISIAFIKTKNKQPPLSLVEYWMTSVPVPWKRSNLIDHLQIHFLCEKGERFLVVDLSCTETK